MKLKRYRTRLLLRWGILLASAMVLSACSLGYYGQAVRGQWEIYRAKADIADVVADEGTEAELAQRLRTAQSIVEFAHQRLGLPDKGSYREYADLGRPYVVWNVVAAPEYSLAPLQHCFPFAGCVAYKGFFSPDKAAAFAAQLRREGYETYEYGVRAYSTLGWLDDPVLNTMLEGTDDLYLAGLIFHELSHQLIYVKGMTEFNESFASAVEELGMELWLDEVAPEKLSVFEQAQKRKLQFLELTSVYRIKLQHLYEREPDNMRQEKRRLFQQLKSEYQELKVSWQGFSGYDVWFEDQLNNAKLAVLSNYYQHVPVFKRLFESCQRDMPRFLLSIKEDVKNRDSAERLLMQNLHLCN